jgi:hypothetical protein
MTDLRHLQNNHSVQTAEILVPISIESILSAERRGEEDSRNAVQNR